ncbi:hypothetical protein JW865_09390 [Candidatus Bathyarchaeota archaeon]|nr:hypothetical protein [Candidatus Bathyarchaeota archaeon]
MIGDPLRKKVEKQIIEVALNNAYNQIVYDLVSKGARNFDLCRKTFTGISVTWDSTQGVYYSNYPAAIVPYVNESMIVNTVQGNGFRFYPTTEQNILLTEGLLCSSQDNLIRTLIKRERIEFYNMESLDVEDIENGSAPTPRVSTIKMNLAIEFSGFDDDDEVYMPMGRDYEVVQLALDLIRNEPIINLRNE